MMLLPPKEGVCPICAVDHKPEMPHNAQSLYYQYRFRSARGRWPTWADAVAHCTADMQEYWRQSLKDEGAWTEPPAGVEVVADPPSESFRQFVPVGTSTVVKLEE
jgi:hypothetical protein